MSTGETKRCERLEVKHSEAEKVLGRPTRRFPTKAGVFELGTCIKAPKTFILPPLHPSVYPAGLNIKRDGRVVVVAEEALPLFFPVSDEL